MKYLKLFENKDFLLNVIKDAVFNDMSVLTKRGITYTIYWLTPFETLSLGIFTPRDDFYNDEFLRAQFSIKWDAVTDYVYKIFKKLPELLPEYISSVEVIDDSSVTGGYDVDITLNENYLRSNKAGLWDLKSK